MASRLRQGLCTDFDDGQSVDAQVKELLAAGPGKVWREKASDATTDRAQPRRVLAQLDASDVLTVT